MEFPKRRKSSVTFRLESVNSKKRKPSIVKKSDVSYLNTEVKKDEKNLSKLQEISIVSKNSLIDLLAADFKSRNTKKAMQNNIDKETSMKMNQTTNKHGNKIQEIDETFNVSFFNDKFENEIKKSECANVSGTTKNEIKRDDKINQNNNIKDDCFDKENINNVDVNNTYAQNKKIFANNNFFDSSVQKSSFCAEDELKKSIDLNDSINISFFAEESTNKVVNENNQENDYTIIINKIQDLYSLFSFDKPEIQNSEEDVIFYLTKLYFSIKDMSCNAVEIINKFKNNGVFLNNQKIDEICKYIKEKSVLKISDDKNTKNNDDIMNIDDANINKTCVTQIKDDNTHAFTIMNDLKFYKEAIDEKEKQMQDLQNEIKKNSDENLKIVSLLRKENFELVNDLKCKNILLKEVEERIVEDTNTAQISVIDEIITKGNEITKNMKDEYVSEIEKKEREVKELKREKQKMEMRISDLEDAVEGLVEKLRNKKIENMKNDV